MGFPTLGFYCITLLVLEHQNPEGSPIANPKLYNAKSSCKS